MTTTPDSRIPTPDSQPSADSLPPLAPDSRPLTPAPRRLPPTPRDIEIYEWVQVQGVSTREAAARRSISQTRVRQIVGRVLEWLAQTLPPQSEIEREQESHLAQKIAADRLQYVYQELMQWWRETNDPKYVRQATRTATSLARLGVIAGSLDALLGDALLADTDEAASSCRGAAVPAAVAGETPAPPSTAPPVEDCSPSADDQMQHRSDPAVAAAVSHSGAVHSDHAAPCAASDRKAFFAPHGPLLSSADDLSVVEFRVQHESAGVTTPHKSSNCR